MWEVAVAPGRLADLLAWTSQVVMAHLDDQATCIEGRVYTSEQEDTARVVVIAEFTGPPAELPEPPPDLVVRAPHQWPFRRVQQRPFPVSHEAQASR